VAARLDALLSDAAPPVKTLEELAFEFQPSLDQKLVLHHSHTLTSRGERATG